jgi:hypothetical protein
MSHILTFIHVLKCGYDFEEESAFSKKCEIVCLKTRFDSHHDLQLLYGKNAKRNTTLFIFISM